MIAAIWSADGRVKMGTGKVVEEGRIGTRHSLARACRAAPPSLHTASAIAKGTVDTVLQTQRDSRFWQALMKQDWRHGEVTKVPCAFEQ